MKSIFSKVSLLLGVSCIALSSASVKALNIDWEGQARFDTNLVDNYAMDRDAGETDAAKMSGTTPKGQYIPSGSGSNATFHSVFMRLKPRVLVNDNITLKSEIEFGDPVYGFLGRQGPIGSKDFSASLRNNATLTASRYYMDVNTDIGNIQLGKAPQHWGLGAIFNEGQSVWSRYRSTVDTIRAVSKFGNFVFSPQINKISMGDNLAGAVDTTLTTLKGSTDDVTEYGIQFMYDNPEEDLELGLFYSRRSGGGEQKAFAFGGEPAFSYKLFNFYGKKKYKAFHAAFEIPYFKGDLGGLGTSGKGQIYDSLALVAEAGANFDVMSYKLKAGFVPGEKNEPTNGDNHKFKAVYLHRNYKIANILFNYNFQNFILNNPDNAAIGANARSPYDSQIVNATYLSANTAIALDKWSINGSVIWAKANETAKANEDYYDHYNKRFIAAVADQESSLGLEFDVGASFKWSDSFELSADTGILFPGKYYAFSNVLNNPNNTGTVIAVGLKASVDF